MTAAAMPKVRKMTLVDGMAHRDILRLLNEWTRDVSQAIETLSADRATSLDASGPAQFPVLQPVPVLKRTSSAGAWQFLPCDPRDGAFSVNLPDATANKGAQIVVKNMTSSTNAITIRPSGDKLDGQTTKVMITPYESTTVFSDGSDWQAI